MNLEKKCEHILATFKAWETRGKCTIPIGNCIDCNKRIEIRNYTYTDRNIGSQLLYIKRGEEQNAFYRRMLKIT